MASDRYEDTLPPLARGVLQLFQDHLAEVQFADLDLGLLRARARELVEAQVELGRVEAALEQARAVAQQRSQALVAAAQRGLSYARIYADGDPDLTARIAQIAEPEGALAESGAPRKRGRPKKNAEAGLFSAMEAEDAATALM